MTDLPNWAKHLQQFCQKYDLSLYHLAEILDDPKVIPMIRGKSFEFSAGEVIGDILSPQKYEVTNPRMNAQIGLHDVDVAIFNKQTGQKYSIECKLASKGSFRYKNKQNSSIKIKCMRSRTLGEVAASRRGELTGIAKELLMVHNDQYIAQDFDIVVTSIANAFYKTDEKGLFYWSPSEEEQIFLRKLGASQQEEAFYKMYAAKSEYLTSNGINPVQCSRRKCKITLQQLEQDYCGFIPNYPTIYFNAATGEPLHPWIPIEQIENLLT